MKLSKAENDRRSFVQLRHDMCNALAAAQFYSSVVLEQLLINEQTSEYLRNVMLSSIKASEIFSIMFQGYEGVEKKPLEIKEFLEKNPKPAMTVWPEVCRTVNLHTLKSKPTKKPRRPPKAA